MSSEYLLDWWKPQDNVCVIFDDKTADPRSTEELDNFFEEMRATANKHGFDINTWGSEQRMHGWLTKVLKGA